MTLPSAAIEQAPLDWSLRVLVIDDARGAEVAGILSAAGHEVTRASPSHALAAASGSDVDVVVAPVALADTVIAQLRERNPEIHAVFLTDRPRADEALAATRGGADYVTATPGHRNLLAPVSAVARRLDQQRRSRSLEAGPVGVLLGNSPLMRALRKEITSAAGAPLAIIDGEPGSGRKTAASALHGVGPRRDAPLIWAAASAITPGQLGSLLVESAGACLAITAAETLSCGAEIAAAIRAGLDGQIIAIRATGARCPELDKIPHHRIAVPPLRSRRDDLPLLVKACIDREWAGSPPPRLTPGAWSTLAARDYPANVSELFSVISGALERCDGEQITRRDVSSRALRKPGRGAPGRLRAWLDSLFGRPLRYLLAPLEIGWGR